MDGMIVSKEAQMSIAASSIFPGFRFSPTDDELISYYLRNKLDGHQDCVQLISQVELCKYEPWDLPGTKRTLVFHLGRAPKGERTEWIMHEYCISDVSQDSLVVCRLKRNTEFRVNDASNRASSCQVNPGYSHESDCATAVSEGQGGIDQRGVCEQDKEVDGSSKLGSSSYGSPSVEQIESGLESNQQPANDANLTESSDHVKVDGEDCYAEILKNDIIKLDEPSMSQRAHKRPQEPARMHPCQGTAQRRIRLRVAKPRRSQSGVRCLSIMHPSKSTLFAGMTKCLMIFAFFLLTLMAMYFWSLFGGHEPVKCWV